jgi:16S rRNA (guanine527-N7)-methyltransferase
MKLQLQKYYEVLITENKKYNLTTITKIDEVFTKHFLDSMLFTNEIVLEKQMLVDIGTGPGFPGIVLKIFYPHLKLTLIESNHKKVNFLNLLISELNLKNVQVVALRAEEYALLNYEKFDLVVSRAVAYLDIILEIGVQLLKVNG